MSALTGSALLGSSGGLGIGGLLDALLAPVTQPLLGISLSDLLNSVTQLLVAVPGLADLSSAGPALATACTNQLALLLPSSGAGG